MAPQSLRFFYLPIRSLAFVTLLVAFGCERTTTEVEQPEGKARPLLEPQKEKRASRCRRLPSSQPITLRSEAGGGKKAAVEVGQAVQHGEGFAIAYLRAGSKTEASVAWTDGKGKQREVSLGVIHGAVEPPLLVSFRDQLLAAVIDNDATSSNIRLARVGGLQGTSPQVVWGPEVQTQREEHQGLSLSVAPSGESAALAWDSYDKSSATSGVHVLRFAPETMKELGPARRLSPTGTDAVEPRLVLQDAGGWLAWLEYGKLDPGAAKSGAALVTEAPRTLRAVRLDSSGAPMGEPQALSGKETHVLAYDVAGNEALTVAYRDEQLARPLGKSSILLSSLGLSGSTDKGELNPAKLGPGAPELFPGSGSDVWLFSRGEDQQVIWGVLSGAAEKVKFEEDSALDGQIPLSLSQGRLLAVRPSGLDLELSVFDCNEHASK